MCFNTQEPVLEEDNMDDMDWTPYPIPPIPEPDLTTLQIKPDPDGEDSLDMDSLTESESWALQMETGSWYPGNSRSPERSGIGMKSSRKVGKEGCLFCSDRFVTLHNKLYELKISSCVQMKLASSVHTSFLDVPRS